MPIWSAAFRAVAPFLQPHSFYFVPTPMLIQSMYVTTHFSSKAKSLPPKPTAHQVSSLLRLTMRSDSSRAEGLQQERSPRGAVRKQLCFMQSPDMMNAALHPPDSCPKRYLGSQNSNTHHCTSDYSASCLNRSSITVSSFFLSFGFLLIWVCKESPMKQQPSLRSLRTQHTTHLGGYKVQ